MGWPSGEARLLPPLDRIGPVTSGYVAAAGIFAFHIYPSLMLAWITLDIVTIEELGRVPQKPYWMQQVAKVTVWSYIVGLLANCLVAIRLALLHIYREWSRAHREFVFTSGGASDALAPRELDENPGVLPN